MQQVQRILCRIHFNLSFILYIVFGKTDIQHNTSILGYQQSEATIPFPDFMPGKKEKDSSNISRTSFFVLIGKTFICTTTQQSTSLSFTTTLCFGRMYLQWSSNTLYIIYSVYNHSNLLQCGFRSSSNETTYHVLVLFLSNDSVEEICKVIWTSLHTFTTHYKHIL